MSFGTFVAILVLMLIAFYLIAILKGSRNMFWNSPDLEEEITETVVTETVDEPVAAPNVAGNLKRQFENDQAYVIDPVDEKKIWLNSNDDMYEDADGKIWRLY